MCIGRYILICIGHFKDRCTLSALRSSKGWVRKDLNPIMGIGRITLHDII